MDSNVAIADFSLNTCGVSQPASHLQVAAGGVLS